MKLWKCGVCGYVHDGDEAPEACPKCGAPREKFAELDEAASGLVKKSRKTNEVHMKVASKLSKVVGLCDAGIDENLDPACVDLLTKTRKHAVESIQMVKAEIEAHMNKGKWG